MDFIDTLQQKAFLGREFLTWLWFKSETTNNRIETTGGGQIQVIFLDRMTLMSSDTDKPQTVSLRGEFNEFQEGLTALREGRKVEEARVSIRHGDCDGG